jgi:DNA polymerase III epsilon subunit family exonuclease
MSELNFAVIDVETTGLFVKGSDRILEIAVLRLSPEGQILDRFETLVNPSRDVGPTFLHGITAGDIKDAPSFGEIAGDVLARLRGSVLVGHNVNFDYRFLESELKRLGVQLPDCMRICTMYIARRLIPMLPSCSLCGVCSLLGIDLEAAHTVMADATATGQLLGKILEQVPVKGLPDLLQLFPRGEWVTPAS